MKIVGLTGGIGSGKTTVASCFKNLGIPVYIADLAAKKLMTENTAIKKEISALLGENSYISGKLNKAYISEQIFSNKALLHEINAIVHPRVAIDFKQWLTAQQTAYVIKESAILFESGGHKKCDFIITVVAPLELRLKRILDRDAISKTAVLSKINNQIQDSERLKDSDFAIENIDLATIQIQVDVIDKKLRKYIAY
jgi:dephospho-CoA kinase